MDLGGSLAVAVLDSIPSLVVVLDRTGRIVRCNRAFEHATGYPLAEVRGGVLWDLFVVPEEVEAVRAAFISLLADRTGGQKPASRHENQWRTRDGELRRISWSDTAILDAGGEVEYVVGTGTDVTERHWAEEDLLRTNQALRALVEASPLAIMVVDRDGLVRVWSPAAERIFGWSRREVLGRVLPIFPVEREAERESILRETFEGRPLSGVEAVRERKDGSRIDVAIWTSLLRGPQDEPESILAVVADIGERKRTEEALRLHTQEVQAASQAKDRFLAVLSHELRTPLTPVLAAVSTLEAGPGLGADLRESLAMIRRNVELEARLIDDLLDLTRISRGKLELHCQAVDAWEILQHAIHICCAQEVAAGRLRLDLGLTPADYRVWADGPRLTQVFWNLLNNAVKFTPEGGTITVRSSLEETAEKRLAVEISDTGIGIEAEMLPRVFDAFEQADRRITRRFGGLGLGLAVSKAILELHGGSLTAVSAGRGHGSTFTVRLPMREPPLDLDDTISDLAPPATASLPAEERALRILLVEDHADTAAAMADLLELVGHRVTVAASVAAGLAAAASAAGTEAGFDLVLSDIGLPDGSGLDLMRELVRLYRLPGIALSGYGMEDDLRKSREAGFALHLTKPLTLQTLKAALLQVTAASGGR